MSLGKPPCYTNVAHKGGPQMAVMSYIQRRRSGVYEFRRRMPQALAGKAVPAHMRGQFPDLINSKAGCFKREYVRSLDAKGLRRRQT